MSEITTKNFKSKLASVIKSAKTQRDNVQSIISFGLSHFKQHEDACYLTQALNAAIGVKSLPTVTLKDYIKEHANLVWQKGKDDKLQFKKEGKDVKVTMPTVAWYEWDGGKHNKVTTDMDVMAQTKALLKRIQAGLKDHKVKDEQAAKNVEAALKVVLEA